MNKNVVLYFDESKFNSEKIRAEKAREKFQALLDEFNKLNLQKLDMAGLADLANKGDAFVKEILEGQIPDQTIANFKLSKKKTVELLELPDLSTLNALALAAQNENWSHLFSCNGQTVSIDQKKIEELKSSHSIKTETPDQLKLFQAHQRLADAIQEFNVFHYRVYGRIMRPDEAIGNLVCIEQESRTESTVIDAVTKVSDYKVNKETGEPLEETLTPAYTASKTTVMDPVAKLNTFFYINNWFPIDR